MNRACWVAQHPRGWASTAFCRVCPAVINLLFLLPLPPFSSLSSLSAFPCSSGNSQRQAGLNRYWTHQRCKASPMGTCTSVGAGAQPSLLSAPDPAEAQGLSARGSPGLRDVPGGSKETHQDSEAADGPHVAKPGLIAEHCLLTKACLLLGLQPEGLSQLPLWP